MFFTKLKRYILLSCQAYMKEDVDEDDKLEVQKLRNWFLTKDGSKSIEGLGIEIERNFISLLSVLELDDTVSVLSFYAKIDYLNKKNAREESAI